MKAKRSSSWLHVALAVLPVAAAAVIGSWATSTSITDWYPELRKPAANPPNWIFGPVWTCLYVLMVYAAWCVLRSSQRFREKSVALALFYSQLALNALWPCLFFGLHSPLAGLINIIPQLCLILATIYATRTIDIRASVSLWPLAAWTAFAAFLNFQIWWMNG